MIRITTESGNRQAQISSANRLGKSLQSISLMYNLLRVAVLLPFLFAIGTAFGQVSVTATAGTTGPTSYTTINAAFAAINAGTHQGAVTISISANTTETGACVLNSSGAGSASYSSVLIRPTVNGVTISGPTVTGRGLIELNGADNVTIDGDNPNTAGTNRNLTITNTAATTVTYTMAIRIAVATSIVTSANNNIIRNCNINGNGTGGNASTVTSTTSGIGNLSYGIYAGGISLGLLRPNYLDIEGTTGRISTIKYSTKDSATFLDGTKIFGGTGLAKGWSEMSISPGLHAKAALRFDWNRFNNALSAIEFGFNFEYYPKKIEQMARVEGRNLFANGYISLVFGKRK